MPYLVNFPASTKGHEIIMGVLDLVDMGKSWIYGISKAHNNILEYMLDTRVLGVDQGYMYVKYGNRPELNNYNSHIETCRGSVPVSLLKPSRGCDDILPTDMGMGQKGN